MMAPRRARYSKIERIVDSLLASSPGGPPVNVETMVRERGVILRKGDLGEVSGLLVRDGNVATIGTNAQQHRVRQRFTIAHEFGHFLLHEGIVEHVDHTYRIMPHDTGADGPRVNFRSDLSSQATDVEEIEANFFAASLLMPRSLLDQASAVLAIDDDRGVKHLANLFDVSAHAMSLRLSNVYRRFAPY